ncbi:tricorn protease homolog 1 [Arthrobacter sp. Hiyo4]|nr:tricorn protease homolog 1 [Arthrobacter sp. Hiyo4]
MGTFFGDVFVADTATGVLSLVTSIGEGSIAELAWSPDSQWLAWSEPVTSFGSRSRLRLANAADLAGGIVEVTDGRFCDGSPSFTPDGKFLAFLSNRSFDPVYDGTRSTCPSPAPSSRTWWHWPPRRRRRLARC